MNCRDRSHAMGGRDGFRKNVLLTKNAPFLRGTCRAYLCHRFAGSSEVGLIVWAPSRVRGSSDSQVDSCRPGGVSVRAWL